MVKEKAKIFHSKLETNSECEYSNGWLQNFKKRHGIHKLRAEGEKSSADYIAATMFVEKLNEYILTEKLTNEQIYNGDETGLFWKCLPESSLACHNENFIDGHKVSKERVTTLLCANAAGTHKCSSKSIKKCQRSSRYL
ncbi:jerky protein homolog [Lucilia sericata]|uniref:jerky protein homolog n=1 Tax=Lucilia sericata TaxID=13632 RepID=UPI0018A806E2|nr:jerky protein homolog [Lucilia sericata]XP_037823853.1 jerky protein homolog [Lucilia sericata]